MMLLRIGTAAAQPGSPSDPCLLFWEKAASVPWGRAHPAAREPGGSIPVLVHGDEAEGHRKRPTLCITVGGVLGQMRMPFIVIPSYMLTPATWDQMLVSTLIECGYCVLMCADLWCYSWCAHVERAAVIA